MDPDANIILGATFDESMEGMIRVSVVATGIDQILTETVVPAEQRMKELTERLRSVAAPTYDDGKSEQTHAAPMVAEQAQSEQAGEAAVAQALDTVEKEMDIPAFTYSRPSEQDPDVSIAPFRPAAVSEPISEEEYEAPKAAAEEQVNAAAPFIPPVAEVPENLYRPMPSVDELPPMIQRELEALRNRESQDHQDDENRPMSLLKRLAAVGLGRRDDEHEQEAYAHHGQPQQQAAHRCSSSRWLIRPSCRQ